MGRFICLSSSLFIIFVACLRGLSLVNCKNNITRPLPTQINRDLYHSSGTLIREIKGLVHRHPDKLRMQTFRTGNKGYKAEISVVTYSRSSKEVDERSKFRILLMIPFLPELWAAWEGAHYN